MPAYKIATAKRYVPEVHSSNIGKNTDYVRSLVIFTVNQRKCKAVCNKRLRSLPYAKLNFTFNPLFSATTYKEIVSIVNASL
jgi:hypothetical protein